MKIKLLGPFRVIRDTKVVTPTAPKLRQVLALLAVHTNAVVRTDQLIEELWEDRPPLSAATTLQTYVYQLRKHYQLHSGGALQGDAANGSDAAIPALRTSPNGYVLSLGEDALDADRFNKLAERGRAELDAGDLEGGASTLREALQLWRGPVLADITAGPVLQAAVVWYEELRNTIAELRIDADLQLGRHRELITELTRMAAEQPTHEGLQAKLMLALYRSGRRSDALRVYSNARTSLADQLGLEPSRELQRLQQAVLAAEPSPEPTKVAREVVQAARPAAVSPSQLPPGLPKFIGRDKQLEAAQALLTDPEMQAARVLVTVGAPGAGKSTFCTHLAHRVRGAFPDGQFYAELVGRDNTPIDSFTVLGGFLGAIGHRADQLPATLTERARVFRSWTADRKVLVVLDDAVNEEQIRPLLPSGPGCATVVASRRRMSDSSIAGTIDLPPFDEAEGVRLLTDVLGRARVAGDMGSVRDLVELCDGLPLAIRAAAAQLDLRPHWPIGRLVARMRQLQSCQTTSDDVPMFSSVRRSYQLLQGETQSAFRTVAPVLRSVSPRHAAEILGVDEWRAETLLEEMVQFQLAEVDEQNGDAGDNTVSAFHYRFRRPFTEVAKSLDRAPTLDITPTLARRAEPAVPQAAGLSA